MNSRLKLTLAGFSFALVGFFGEARASSDDAAIRSKMDYIIKNIVSVDANVEYDYMSPEQKEAVFEIFRVIERQRMIIEKDFHALHEMVMKNAAELHEEIRLRNALIDQISEYADSLLREKESKAQETKLSETSEKDQKPTGVKIVGGSDIGSYSAGIAMRAILQAWSEKSLAQKGEEYNGILVQVVSRALSRVSDCFCLDNLTLHAGKLFQLNEFSSRTDIEEAFSSLIFNGVPFYNGKSFGKFGGVLNEYLKILESKNFLREPEMSKLGRECFISEATAQKIRETFDLLD